MTKSVRIFWKIFFGGFAFLILLLLMLNFGWIGSMPDLEDIENPTASLASQVYAEDGTLMGKYYIEDRINVQYKDISKHVINALVATEDERFFEHSGIDVRALGRVIKGVITGNSKLFSYPFLSGKSKNLKTCIKWG